MLTRESLFVILYSLPIYQLLFYTVQLITFKKSNPSRRYLGLMMLVMTLFLVMNAVYHLGYEFEMRWFYYFFVPALLSVAPIFYLYLISLTHENHDVDSRTRFFLFLPPIIILMLNFIIFRALSFDQKLTFLNNGFTVPHEIIAAYNPAILVHKGGILGFLVIQLLLALTGGYKMMKREIEVMEKSPGHLAYLQPRWIVIISLCVLIFLAAGSLLNLSGKVNGFTTAIVFNGLMLVAGGLSGYFGMKQDSLLIQVSKVRGGLITEGSDPAEEEDVMPEEVEEGPSGLIDEAEASEIMNRLTEMMKKEKPYLNPKYSMHDLCEGLDLSRRKVTYVINEVMDKNFYGVINDYRIEEAINLLKDPKSEDYKMDAIAEMVGFQSKSSFYACFKKYTGVTPTEFRLKIK